MQPDTPETRLFFGEGTARPIRQATDLVGYLREDRRHHYRDGYSMAEAAKCWVQAEGRLPNQLAELLGHFNLTTAHFEYEVVVWGGGTSTTDIMAFVPNGVIAIEAKSRESFDDEVRVWIERESGNNPRSPTHRTSVIHRYAEAFGTSFERLLPIRYQLIHRTLSAALTAYKYGLQEAWMIVQSFAPASCVEHIRNRGDFDRYLNLVGTAPVLNEVPVRLAWLNEAA